MDVFELNTAFVLNLWFWIPLGVVVIAIGGSILSFFSSRDYLDWVAVAMVPICLGASFVVGSLMVHSADYSNNRRDQAVAALSASGVVEPASGYDKDIAETLSSGKPLQTSVGVFSDVQVRAVSLGENKYQLVGHVVGQTVQWIPLGDLGRMKSLDEVNEYTTSW